MLESNETSSVVHAIASDYHWRNHDLALTDSKSDARSSLSACATSPSPHIAVTASLSSNDVLTGNAYHCRRSRSKEETFDHISLVVFIYRVRTLSDAGDDISLFDHRSRH